MNPEDAYAELGAKPPAALQAAGPDAGGVGAPKVSAPPAHIFAPMSRRQWALMALWFALPVTFLIAGFAGFLAHP